MNIVCYLDPAAVDANTKSVRVGDYVFVPGIPREVPERAFLELQAARSRPSVEHPNGLQLIKRGLPRVWEEAPPPSILRRARYYREGRKLVFGPLVPFVRRYGNRLFFELTGPVSKSADGRKVQIREG